MSEVLAKLEKKGGSGFANISVGDIVTGSLTGSHTIANYDFQVCYASKTRVCLLGVSSITSTTNATARGYSWNATFQAGAVTGNPITVTGVKIPTLEQLSTLIANYSRGFHYWTGSVNGGNAYCPNFYGTGSVYSNAVGNSSGVLPFVIIDL